VCMNLVMSGGDSSNNGRQAISRLHKFACWLSFVPEAHRH
jgi:hypothetical protein